MHHIAIPNAYYYEIKKKMKETSMTVGENEFDFY